MQIKKGNGTIKALEIPDSLQRYNVANNVTRARLLFSFGVENTDSDDITAQLLGRIGNNSFSVIIDITDLGLQKAQRIFVGKQAVFTVFSFTIAELTGNKYNIVNNGEREYSGLSSPHVGEADEKSCFENLVKRLKKDLQDGKLMLGGLPQSNMPQQQRMQQQPVQTPPPAQGDNNDPF